MILGALQTHALAGDDVTILAPPRHVGIGTGHVYVVGRTGAPIVEIQLNDDIVRSVIPKDSIFHAPVWFGYGLFDITATAIFTDSAATRGSSDTVEILSAPSISHDYERFFSPYRFHGTQEWGSCLECHTADASVASAGTDVEGGCFECHSIIGDRFRRHIPQNDTACVICHKIESDLTLVSTGTYSDENPCYVCHQNKISQFTQEYIHGPVAGGTCTICHDPHGSEYEKSLINPVQILCLSCHTELDDLVRLNVQHPPFALGRCGECHDPHATSNKWVLVKNSRDVCTGCHDDMGGKQPHSHPFDVKPKGELATPLKLTPTGELECLSCHHPHASNTVHLLRTDQANTCLGCHPDQ